jgi:hypothetical protein
MTSPQEHDWTRHIIASANRDHAALTSQSVLNGGTFHRPYVTTIHGTQGQRKTTTLGTRTFAFNGTWYGHDLDGHDKEQPT